MASFFNPVRQFLMVIVAAFGILAWAPPAHADAGSMRTMEIDGVAVEYFVPGDLPVKLSADGKTLHNAVKPVVLVSNPVPSPEPVRIPPPAAALDDKGRIDPRQATAQFSITYVPAGGSDPWGVQCMNFPQAARTTFDAAAAIWGNILQSSVPITISACWASLSGNTLGYSGGGNNYRDFSNAPRANTWYNESLANSLSGTDQGPGKYDMHITYNDNFTWYYGTDGNTPAGQSDLLTVVLHEIAHGLNFSGSMQYASGQAGWGYGTGYPNIWDTLMYDGSGNQIINTSIYPNPSTALGSVVTSNNLWFQGSKAMAANGSARVKMYAPSTWKGGSSYSHLDYDTFKGTQNRLMVFAISAGDSIHDPGPVATGLLQDLGWNSGSGPTPPPPPSEAWKTEVGIVNMASSTTTGTLRGFDASGAQAWSQSISLPPLGRTSLDVSQAAGSSASQIKSMRLDISSGAAVGYQKFYQTGKYRVGLEALPTGNQSAMYIPHIHSDSTWWTGVGLLNTTSSAKSLQFNFSNGSQSSQNIGANAHTSFLVSNIISGTFVGSATVTNGAGMAGLMLFGSDNQLSGVSLSDNSAHTLVFPHVEQNGWWTGVGIYNPNTTPLTYTLNVYDSNGGHLGSNSYNLQALDSHIAPTALPSSAAWFTMESPSLPIMGFELFGTDDGKMLGGYSVVDLATTQGVFPKLETSGWTGIAFVNVGASAATITLEARDNSGNIIATQNLSLQPKAKQVKIAESFFSSSIASASYIRFTSDQNIVGFQLNGSTDGTMLDAIPALGSSANYGTSTLYFPHIDAQ